MLAITPPRRKTAVLSFTDEYSAYEFGRLLESHRAATKEWPDLTLGKIHIHDNGTRQLKLIDIIEWKLDDLKHVCATRYLNMILVEEFLANKNLMGHYLALEAETDELINHLNYLWGHQSE
jgi:hypothetical protein